MFKSSIVSFVFDDGYEGIYTDIKPIFDIKNIVGCIAIISDYLNSPTYMSRSQCLELQNKGWEIMGHTKTHPHLTTLTKKEIKYELQKSKTDLEENNLIITNLVYPYHDYNKMVREIAKDYYCSARRGYTKINNFPLDLYSLNSILIDNPKDLSRTLKFVDTIKDTVGWAIFYMHYCLSEEFPTITLQDKINNLINVINYIQTKNIQILTIKKTLERIFNV